MTGFENIVLGVLDLTQPGLNALIYATYFGSSIVDDVRKLSLDANGRLLLAGWTLSSDFPVTPNALMGAYLALGNGLVARVNPFAQPGSFVEYATFVGGSGGDVAWVRRPLRDRLYAVTGFPGDPGCRAVALRNIRAPTVPRLSNMARIWEASEFTSARASRWARAGAFT